MSPPPLRPLMAAGRPTLRNLSAQSEVYVHLEKRAHALRQQLFGYAKGFPGENAWLKPLKGKELIEYYWPSKHDLPSFHMEQYFEMQALRYAPKKTHPGLLSLSRLLGLMAERRKEVRALLSQVDEDLYRENPTLQDLYALYRSLFSDDPLKDVVPEQKHWQWTDALRPDTLLALLEASARLRGEEGHFDKVLQEADQCQSLAELKETLQRRVGEELSPSLAPSLLFLAAKTTLVLPAPCCSHKAQRLKGPPLEIAETAGETAEWRRDRKEAADRRAARLRLLGLAAAAGMQPAAESVSFKEPPARGGPGDAERQRERDALSLGLLKTPQVYRHPICLQPAETEDERRKREERQLEAQQELQRAMEKDSSLEVYVHSKHRFFDPLFKRRRISFLDRLARSRIKSAKEREIGSEVYLQHPDKRKTFPSNKGFLTRKWPSPYH